jgi:hypothetical protein
MTDPIRIPVIHLNKIFAEVTPEIARQIVALAGLYVGPDGR